MKKVVWTLGMLLVTSGMASAQDTNELVPTAPVLYEDGAQAPSALDKAIIANERKLMEFVAKKDKAGFTAMVTPDAIGLDAMMGVMKTSDFAAMLDQVSITTWKISDEKVHVIDANNAVIAYKWTGTGTFQGQNFPSPVWASTVWTKKGDKWLAAFHQETEAVKPPPAPAKK
jgi:hypothetical protein